MLRNGVGGVKSRARTRGRGPASIRPRGFIKWPIRKSVVTESKRYDKILASTTSKREARGMAIAGHMSRGLREGGLILLGAIAVYLLISLATYAPSAPGWSRSGTGAGVANIGGVAGAWVADVFLFLFGYLAYLVPLMVGYAAGVFFRGRHEEGDQLHEQAKRKSGFALSFAAGAGLATKKTMHPLSLPVTGGGVLG